MKPKTKKQTKREWKEWRIYWARAGVSFIVFATKKEAVKFASDATTPYKIIRVLVKEL